MSNYNKKSVRIIKSWYKIAQNPVEEPNDYFDRFISVWISFNAYFVAEFHEEACKLAKNHDPWERKYLEAIYSDQNNKNIYLDLIGESEIFKENLEIFMELLKNTRCPGHISDMRRQRNGCENAQEFSDINNFEQFILITYRIRCNLFHGNKLPNSDDDLKIVKTIFTLLNCFLTKIYQKQGYLND